MLSKLIFIISIVQSFDALPHNPQYILLPAHDVPQRYEPLVDQQKLLLTTTLPQRHAVIGPPYVSQNGIVYLHQQSEASPQPAYPDSIYNYLARRPELTSPESDSPKSPSPTEKPVEEETLDDAQNQPEEPASSKSGDEKPESAKLEDFEPDAELIPGGETRSEPQPPQIPVTPFQGILPGQGFYLVNPTPQFNTVFGYPQYSTVYTPGGYHQRFFLIGQPSEFQTHPGQTIYLLGSGASEQLRSSQVQRLQIPPLAISTLAREAGNQEDEYLKSDGSQDAGNQSEVKNIQSDENADNSEGPKSQNLYDNQQQHSVYGVPENYQRSKVAPKKQSESAPVDAISNQPKSNDEEDDSVSIEASDETNKEKETKKSKRKLVHADLKTDPTIAQAKPQAIAIAGAGGSAQSHPLGTSIAGPEGLAISDPVATALAGPLAYKNYHRN